MQCPICKSRNVQFRFTSKVLKKFTAKYYSCDFCNFLWIEKPTWLLEAYKSPISVCDTGILSRNIKFSKLVKRLILFCLKKEGKYLDYAGGYGIFTRLMRDNGFDFYWDDIYSKNMFAKGYEYKKTYKLDAVTCFECFEHFENPIKEIEKILLLSDTLIFSTGLLPNQIPKPGDWWYYGLEHGQHIAFYSEKTLKWIASKYGFKFYRFGALFIFSRREISLVKLFIERFKLIISKLFGFLE